MCNLLEIESIEWISLECLSNWFEYFFWNGVLLTFTRTIIKNPPHPKNATLQWSCLIQNHWVQLPYFSFSISSSSNDLFILSQQIIHPFLSIAFNSTKNLLCCRDRHRNHQIDGLVCSYVFLSLMSWKLLTHFKKKPILVGRGNVEHYNSFLFLS